MPETDTFDKSNYEALARSFLAEQRTAGQYYVFWRNSFWRWSGTHYAILSDDLVEDEITRWLARQSIFNTTGTLTVFRQMRAMVRDNEPTKFGCWLQPKINEERNDIWLTARNGLLNLTQTLKTGEMTILPHSPRFFDAILLPYVIDVSAQCPHWEACLASWQMSQTPVMEFLQEYCGYLLTPTTHHQIALFLEGTGANGKTVFCEVVRALLGEDNVSAVPIEEFGSRFKMYATLGKLANISTETDTAGRLHTGIIKQFISGDAMYFEQKYMPGITASPTARLIVVWNQKPEILDRSDGWWRRVKLVKFRRQYGPAERDPFLVQKLLAELPGIFNWAVAGLRRLTARGELPEVESMTADLAEFRRNADPIRAFLQECCCVGDDCQAIKRDVYAAYLSWSDANDFIARHSIQFWQQLRELAPIDDGEMLRVGLNRHRIIRGLMLRNDAGKDGPANESPDDCDNCGANT